MYLRTSSGLHPIDLDMLEDIRHEGGEIVPRTGTDVDVELLGVISYTVQKRLAVPEWNKDPVVDWYKRQFRFPERPAKPVWLGSFIAGAIAGAIVGGWILHCILITF